MFKNKKNTNSFLWKYSIKETVLDALNDVGTLDKDSCIDLLNSLIKIFDEHFIRFIELRKQKDLYILALFNNILLNDISEKNGINFFNEYKLSSFFTKDKDGRITIDIDIEQSINEVNLAIKSELEELKSLEIMVFNVTKNKDYDLEDFEENIIAKIGKLNTLTDANFIDMVTKDEKITKQLNYMLHFGTDIRYDKIIANGDKILNFKP